MRRDTLIQSRSKASFHSIAFAFAIGLSCSASPAFAQSGDETPMMSQGGMRSMPMDHSKRGAMMQGDATSPSSKAFSEANDKMHADMSVELTGDADVDFVRGMIPHHQGAIDMAKIELQYGKDKELRVLAEGIITAQKKEIAEMQAWLKQHGH